jgi:hypothetical protein
MSKIIIDLRLGDTLKVGDVLITLEKKSGQLARLNVQAPDETQIYPPRQKIGKSSVRRSAPEPCLPVPGQRIIQE